MMENTRITFSIIFGVAVSFLLLGTSLDIEHYDYHNFFDGLTSIREDFWFPSWKQINDWLFVHWGWFPTPSGILNVLIGILHAILILLIVPTAIVCYMFYWLGYGIGAILCLIIGIILIVVHILSWMFTSKGTGMPSEDVAKTFCHVMGFIVGLPFSAYLTGVAFYWGIFPVLALIPKPIIGLYVFEKRRRALKPIFDSLIGLFYHQRIFITIIILGSGLVAVFMLATITPMQKVISLSPELYAYLASRQHVYRPYGIVSVDYQYFISPLCGMDSPYLWAVNSISWKPTYSILLNVVIGIFHVLLVLVFIPSLIAYYLSFLISYPLYWIVKGVIWAWNDIFRTHYSFTMWWFEFGNVVGRIFYLVICWLTMTFISACFAYLVLFSLAFYRKGRKMGGKEVREGKGFTLLPEERGPLKEKRWLISSLVDEAASRAKAKSRTKTLQAQIDYLNKENEALRAAYDNRTARLRLMYADNDFELQRLTAQLEYETKAKENEYNLQLKQLEVELRKVGLEERRAQVTYKGQKEEKSARDKLIELFQEIRDKAIFFEEMKKEVQEKYKDDPEFAEAIIDQIKRMLTEEGIIGGSDI